MWLTGLEPLGHQVAQAVNLGLTDPALRDPRGAHAQAGGIVGRGVAWDGVAVDHNAGQVEDARRHIPRKRGALFADDGFGVDVQEVRVGAAEWDAEAVTLHALGPP